MSKIIAVGGSLAARGAISCQLAAVGLALARASWWLNIDGRTVSLRELYERDYDGYMERAVGAQTEGGMLWHPVHERCRAQVAELMHAANRLVSGIAEAAKERPAELAWFANLWLESGPSQPVVRDVISIRVGELSAGSLMRLAWGSVLCIAAQ